MFVLVFCSGFSVEFGFLGFGALVVGGFEFFLMFSEQTHHFILRSFGLGDGFCGFAAKLGFHFAPCWFSGMVGVGVGWFYCVFLFASLVLLLSGGEWNVLTAAVVSA